MVADVVWFKLFLIVIPPAVVGALIGAGFGFYDDSPLWSLLSGHGLPENYHTFGLTTLLAAPVLVGYLAWSKYVHMRFFVPVICGGAICGYILGSYCADFVKQNVGMTVVLTFGMSLAYFVYIALSEILVLERGVVIKYWCEQVFVFGAPYALIFAFIGAEVHLEGMSPLYQVLRAEGLPDAYHTMVLAIVLGIPLLIGAIGLWKRGARLLEYKEAHLLIAGGALVGYAFGAIMGDVVKYHFEWVLVAYKVLALLVIAAFLDTCFFHS